MRTENLQPPDEPRTSICPDCLGMGVEPFLRHGRDNAICPGCNGTGEIVEEDPRHYFDEVKADDERHPEINNQLNNKDDE